MTIKKKKYQLLTSIRLHMKALAIKENFFCKRYFLLGILIPQITVQNVPRVQ